jgi:hypothetical protein
VHERADDDGGGQHLPADPVMRDQVAGDEHRHQRADRRSARGEARAELVEGFRICAKRGADDFTPSARVRRGRGPPARGRRGRSAYCHLLVA